MPLAASYCTIQSEAYKRTFLTVGSDLLLLPPPTLPIDPFVWYHPTMISTPPVSAPPRASIQIGAYDDPGAFHPSLGLVHSSQHHIIIGQVTYRIALLRLLGTTLTLPTQYHLYPNPTVRDYTYNPNLDTSTSSYQSCQ
ncbi:hypothetical protein EDD16DRAFT_1716117 [Pisolithus croceorrhizus]|nr:hypothetical protein EDD16DRAFT_1716117 [Pisolithus croceorrhizus]